MYRHVEVDRRGHEVYEWRGHQTLWSARCW